MYSYSFIIRKGYVYALAVACLTFTDEPTSARLKEISITVEFTITVKFTITSIPHSISIVPEKLAFLARVAIRLRAHGPVRDGQRVEARRLAVRDGAVAIGYIARPVGSDRCSQRIGVFGDGEGDPIRRHDLRESLVVGKGEADGVR